MTSIKTSTKQSTRTSTTTVAVTSASRARGSRNSSVLVLALVLLLSGVGAGAAWATEADQADDATLEAMINDGRAEAVEEAMEAEADSAAPSERTHYWQARAQLAQIEDASVFRKVGLARSARKHLETAIDLDPDSVRARETLAGYYIQAPAMAGGSLEAAAKQADRIEAIDAAAGYRVRARIAEAEDDHEAAVAWRRRALAASDWSWDTQYSIVITAVHYQLESAPALLDEAETAVRRHAESPGAHTPLLDYQRGKYAAVSGRELEPGQAALTRYLDHEPLEGEPQRTWAEFRLAQVERQLGLADEAETRLSGLEAREVPEDLGFALRDERRWHYD